MIELQGISQTYPGPSGPVEALRGIDLKVSAGEIFGVIGRSGAGKSSLVRVINLLNRPTAGQVLVLVLVLILFVQAVQSLGDWAVRRLSHK